MSKEQQLTANMHVDCLLTCVLSRIVQCQFFAIRVFRFLDVDLQKSGEVSSICAWHLGAYFKSPISQKAKHKQARKKQPSKQPNKQKNELL